MIILQTPKLLKLFSAVGQAHLGFIILVSDKNHKKIDEILNHEKIHIQQQRETLVIFWYIIYFLDFFINWGIFGSFWVAYEEVLFEREAFEYENDYNYLENRKRYKWFSFIGDH